MLPRISLQAHPLTKKVIIYVVIIAVSVATGRFLAPEKVQEKEKIKYVDKIVEKKVYVKDKTTKKNTVVTKLVTIRPDGTKTIETKIDDKDTVEVTQKDSDKIVDNKSETVTKEKTVTNKKENTIISAAVKANVTNIQGGVNYGVMLNQRVIGPVHAGGFGFNDGTVGVSVGVGF